jgi:hypothetical protein
LLATGAVPDGSSIVNIGRINNGTLSNSALFVSKPITVRNASSQGFPFDYVATDVIESGDSGGPDELPGTALPHTIVAVNSGAGGGTEVLARVDLLKSFISDKIAAHGGTGGGGVTPPPPPPPPPPTTCTGPSETEPNDTFQTPNPLGSSVCGKLGGSDNQDWYSWSIGGSLPYDVKLSATGDGAIRMWKQVNGTFREVTSGSTGTEIANTASGAGSYLVAVFTSTGATQSYSLRLTK